jgi:hypothetical protein
MESAPTLIPAMVSGLLLVVALLRVMAHVHRADEIADRQWEELTHLESESGVAFFPTVDARLELELAMADVVELARRPPRPARASRAALTRLIAA